MPISRSNKPAILLSAGDNKGIGPEIIVRALSSPSVRRLAKLTVIGDRKYIDRAKRALNIFSPINVLDLGSKNDGRDPLRYLDKAIALIKEGRAGGLVTAPVNKESITRSGVRFYGHTEYLAAATKSEDIAMLFAGERLKVAVVTRHIPLARVSKALTKEKICRTAMLTYHFLKSHFGIKKPRLGILAINPHAGEGGSVGREEIETILPAVKALKRRLTVVKGPIPADSGFNMLYSGLFDALVAMYHDQAMIPVKMVGRKECVNITLGLPFVRTSPVHGTAYDIAGKGVADASGMVAAIRFACGVAGKC